MKISQKNFMIAWENKRLIRGALKAAHVRMDYSGYDDLYQNAVLTYAEMLEKYADKPRKEVDKLSFKKILWSTLNELKKVQRICEHDCSLEEAEKLSEKFNIDDLIILKDEMKKMKELDRAILIEHVTFQRKMTDMDREYDVHRVTLQRTKRRLLNRLKTKMSE